MFFNELKGYVYVYTSMLGEVRFPVDFPGPYSVAVFCNDEKVFETILTSLGEHITVYDLDDVVAEYCEDKGLSTASLRVDIVADETVLDSYVLNTLYCREIRPMPGLTESQVAQNALSDSKLRVVSGDFPDYISYLPDNDMTPPPSALITFSKESGEKTSLSAELPTDAETKEVLFVPIDFNSIRKLGSEADAGSPSLVNVVYGRRSTSFIFFKQKPLISFYFRNAYNAWELVEIHGAIKAKNSVSQSLAARGKTQIAYDRLISRSFEITAQIRFASDIQSLLDLVGSSDVRLADSQATPAECPEILITESDLSPQFPGVRDNNLKFTFTLSKGVPEKRLRDQHRLFNYNFVYNFA